MAYYTVLESREAWLKARGKTIGGSDAACLVGMNPWRSNVGLYHALTSDAEPEEQTSPAMEYGTRAEPHLRWLFSLDYPETVVLYEPNNLWKNDKYPFAHASLDGWLIDNIGRKGVLEIKTATISSGAQMEKWSGRIPDNYYIQVLWYMAVCEMDFAIVRALLKTPGLKVGGARLADYTIERADVEDDIEVLMGMGEKFWKFVQARKEPPRILPEV